jgi:hypothetical protein
LCPTERIRGCAGLLTLVIKMAGTRMDGVLGTRNTLGMITDLVAHLHDPDYPKLTGLVADLSGRRVFLPATAPRWRASPGHSMDQPEVRILANG